MTTIKYNAMEEVFWLSPTGFRKGFVKKVSFYEEIFQKKAVSKLSYYCTCQTYNDKYEGDKISEEVLFKSYDELVEYYKNNSPT